MADHELHSFITKLINLRRAGMNARLTVECQDGKTYIDLQLHLENPPGPVHHKPRPRPSPSRLRRRARRENARNTEAASDPIRDTLYKLTIKQILESTQ